ncbi:CaiB/BaiF CoA transferase family protein [Chloroflexota bacterium]
MQEGFLKDVKVLDLTDEKGFLCGKILGDLGADVIKIEPPGGTPSRNIGPFYKDIPHPEKSLYWYAYNANKRGITLDIETADGREIFKRLAGKANFIIESFKVGYLDNLGIGYDALSSENPGLIMVSITPFGQTGPYKDYEASDIVAIAMGGEMYVTGEPDRPPLRISFPQAYLHGGITGAVASMIAHYHAGNTGEGQHVDVSICESLISFSGNAAPFWYMLKENLTRQGSFRAGTAGKSITRLLWPCKDGHVSFTVMGTPAGARSNLKLMDLMDEHGMADQLKSFNWDGFDRRTANQETQTYVEEAVAPFIASMTKKELLEAAVKKGIMLLPVYTPAELLDYVQLKERGYWEEVDHPELGRSITYPGAFIKSSEMDCSIRRRAPLIGEHNKEIYTGELGFSGQDLAMLKEAGVI